MKKDHLENLSIFELRDLARKIGVFNPTVLKKQDLILAIYDVQSGKIKPHVAKTKQGRPAKSIGALDNIVNIFLPPDILSIPTREEAMFDKQRSYTFNCDPIITPDCPVSVEKGYMEYLNSGCGLLRKKISAYQEPIETVYIISKYMVQYKLREGDEIVCYAATVQPDKPKVLFEITQINGKPVDEFDVNRANIDNLPFDNNTKNINFKTDEMKKVEEKLELQYGDTIFCHHTNSLNFKTFASNLIEKENNAFDNYIYLSPSTTPLNSELLKNTKAELYYSDFNDSFYIQERLSFLAHNRAKRLAEQGKNVCFIIDDIKGLVSIEKGCIDELTKTRKILSIAKNLEKGSITIICSFPPMANSMLGNFILSTFAPLEKVALFLEDKEINLNKSYRN